MCHFERVTELIIKLNRLEYKIVSLSMKSVNALATALVADKHTDMKHIALPLVHMCSANISLPSSHFLSPKATYAESECIRSCMLCLEQYVSLVLRLHSKGPYTDAELCISTCVPQLYFVPSIHTYVQ